MPYRKISEDLKEVAVRIANNGQGLDNVLETVGFSASTYWRTVQRLRETGSVSFQQPVRKGRHRKLLREDEDYILALMQQNPALFLDEYARLLDQNRAISVSIPTMYRLFSRHGITYKRAKKVARERDPLARADFRRQIARHPITALLCIDETSKDERTYFRSYGRALKGQSAEIIAPFVRGQRYTLLPAMDITGIVAYKVVEGSFDRERFIAFLQDHIVCEFFVE